MNELESGENLKSIKEHLIEIRKRITIIFGFFIFILIISYFLTPGTLNYLKSSAADYNISLNVFKITESVTIYLQTMLFLSICLTLPFLFGQIYFFIKPALNKQTQKISLILIPIISVLFFVGSSIGLFIFVPLLLTFFLEATVVLGMNTVYSFSDFYSFVFTICLIFGLFLEIPAITSFLTFIGILTPEKLKSIRRFVYIFLTFVAVISTPPDFISGLIVLGVLISLYELSIFIAYIIFHRFRKKQTMNTVQKGGDLSV
ncbi:twin-arginine translocase subunit TatC [Sutcliffiella sp. NPDC057660]|uniref:twin-arginine translocase subunit TatC n=1 Tax=Sutcliffiella sp. NPDC057660 TaxID=3346199 RepID=UPI00369227C4